jgi:hemerythrin-like domain-containing protein
VTKVIGENSRPRQTGQEEEQDMAQPTAILRQEHEAVTRMLEAAEQAAGKLDRGEPVRPDLLGGIGEFFELFVDRCHHGKEEELFFPALAKKGMPVHGGPIGVMLHEHEEGRQLARQMKELASAYEKGDREAGKGWASAARRYAQLLREHILKENQVLFPMAEGILSPAEEEALAAQFEQLEIEKMGRGTHERLHARMAKIFEEVSATAGTTKS